MTERRRTPRPRKSFEQETPRESVIVERLRERKNRQPLPDGFGMVARGVFHKMLIVLLILVLINQFSTC